MMQRFSRLHPLGDLVFDLLRRALPVLVLLTLAPISASSQMRTDSRGPAQRNSDTSTGPRDDNIQDNPQILAARAIAALKRLDDQVLIYRSLREFEEHRKLAHVQFEVFQKALEEVLADIQQILFRLPENRVKIEIANALYSYRDGAFWWSKLDQQKVITTANLSLRFATTTPAEGFLTATVPYTVAIHWRQANGYLLRAQELLAEANSKASANSRGLVSNRNLVR